MPRLANRARHVMCSKPMFNGSAAWPECQETDFVVSASTGVRLSKNEKSWCRRGGLSPARPMDALGGYRLRIVIGRGGAAAGFSGAFFGELFDLAAAT